MSKKKYGQALAKEGDRIFVELENITFDKFEVSELKPDEKDGAKISKFTADKFIVVDKDNKATEYFEEKVVNLSIIQKEEWLILNKEEE